MTAQLTPRRRLLRAIRHEPVDRVPISPRFFDYLHGTAGCTCPHHCLDFARRFDFDPMVPYRPPQNNYLLHHHGPYHDLPQVTVTIDTEDTGDTLTIRRRFRTPAGELTDVRCIVRPGSTVTFDHIIEPAVKDRADLDRVRYLLVDPALAFVGEIPLLVKAFGEHGLLTVQATQGVDQFLMDALGVEHALLMWYDDPDLLRDLLRLFLDYHQAILRRILELDVVDVIFEPWYNLGVSVGWSPAQLRELALPLIREDVALIHTHGVLVDYYDDGKLKDVLPDLADAGVDVVETLAPPPLGDVELADAKRGVGDRLCLKGHVDQVNIVNRGTPEQVRQAVKDAIAIGAPGSGFILGTADSFRPETPPQNLRAYFQAAHEFGRNAT